MVDTRNMPPEVQQVMTFYGQNYELIVDLEMPRQGAKRLIRPMGTPRICRFCKGAEPGTTFQSNAHTVPECVGNGTVLSPDECDDCNKRLSGAEDDFAKFTMPDRTFGKIPGKRGVPKIKSSTDAIILQIKEKTGALHIQTDHAKKATKVNREERRLTVTVPLQSYRPLGVYKALLKMAISVLPDDDLSSFDEALCWLRSDGVTQNVALPRVGLGCYRTIEASRRNDPYVLLLLRRRQLTTMAPYATFILSFGHWTYQIFLPSPKRDAHLEGQRFDIWAFPTRDIAKPMSPGHWATTEWVDFHSPLLRRVDQREFDLRYDSLTRLSPGPE